MCLENIYFTHKYAKYVFTKRRIHTHTHQEKKTEIAGADTIGEPRAMVIISQYTSDFLFYKSVLLHI